MRRPPPCRYSQSALWCRCSYSPVTCLRTVGTEHEPLDEVQPIPLNLPVPYQKKNLPTKTCAGRPPVFTKDDLTPVEESAGEPDRLMLAVERRESGTMTLEEFDKLSLEEQVN